MRHPIAFLGLATCISLAPARAQHPASDIVDTAVAAGSFKTLAKALSVAGLVDALRGDGPFTVFAPTDAAFQKLPEGTLQELLAPEGRERLTAILKFHVLGKRIGSKQVGSLRSAESLLGSAVSFGGDGDALTVAGANVVKADLACSNGVIHVIDGVLLPPEKNIVELARDAGKFNTLWQAAKAAGLAGALSGDGPFTVLAPTDEAFARIPERTLQSLLQPSNIERLRAILSYHVIKGRVFAADALAARDAATLQGDKVRFDIADGSLRVNGSKGARVTATDLQASNGVVHIIDSVLMPMPTTKGRKVVGLFVEVPGEALAEQLGVEREGALLVTGLVAGGAAEAAGLRKFDVILRIDGKAATRAELDSAKNNKDVGESIALEVRRRGKTLAVHVPVGVERG